MTTIHNLDTVRYMIPIPSAPQAPETVKAPPMAVAKALALIVLAVAVVGAGVLAGVVFLAFPPPAPTVVVQPAA
ncbi:MAG TPA: hypothetical protein VLU24_07150 [Mycobacterium sp.]|nr:hypothetical protein [Mycobacterium sp.]